MPWHPTLIDSRILSVHAALLPRGPMGKVVMLGGSEHNPPRAAATRCRRIRSTSTGPRSTTADAARIASPTTEVFCAGHAYIADGRLLIGGGTESWGGEDAEGPGGGHVHGHGNFGGHRACWIFNQERETWTRTSDFGF
jgi:hypothetical protein